jgi:hypothetical protein
MMWQLLVELAIIVVASVAFVGVLGDPRRARDPMMAWHLWSFAALAAVEAASLLALGLGVPVPLWVFVTVYAGQAGVAVWRLWLMVQGRRWAGRRQAVVVEEE